MESLDIKKILLTPIEVIGHSGRNTKICIEYKKIDTTQRYANRLDADMSDVAVLFYEIIYSDILKSKSLLNERRYCRNELFAGNTMNSFNSIERTLGAGTSSRADWPESLSKYFESYHCLANFWLLPMDLGRKLIGGDLNKGAWGEHRHRDYMDSYLKEIEARYQPGRDFDGYEGYFKSLADCKMKLDS